MVILITALAANVGIVPAGSTAEAPVPVYDATHAHLKMGSGALMLHDEFPELGGEGAKAPTRLGGTICTIHLEVPDADAAWQRAI